MLKIFIAATDTDAGKTYISTEILKFFSRKGYKTIGMKPVAYGCYEYKGMIISEDAELLQQSSSIQLPYEQINPVRYKKIAVGHDESVTSKLLLEKYNDISRNKTDILLVEGMGGWCPPINKTETMADFVGKTDLAVILVVKMKLGCLNHGILSLQNMLSRNVKVSGWIANCHEANEEILEPNIQTLKEHLKVPFLGRIDSNEEITDNSELAESLERLRKTSLST